jgi:hypothetical protein
LYFGDSLGVDCSVKESFCFMIEHTLQVGGGGGGGGGGVVGGRLM